MKDTLIRTGAMPRNEIIASSIVLIVYAVGIAGISMPHTTGLFIKLIPVVIVLSLIVSLSFHNAKAGLKTCFVFAAIVLFSWIIEAAGIATGAIFGDYSYGPALGLKLMETPLLIGFNWLLLVYGSAALASKLDSQVLSILAGAFLMVIYDIVLEVVAPVLGMWQFGNGAAPPQNYVAWFLLALLFHLLLRIAGIRISNRVAALVFVVQLVFFLALLIIFRVK